MRFVWTLTAASAIVALLAPLAACASSGSSDGGNVFTGTDGALLFQQGCASCHGVDLQGTDQGPPFLHQFYVPGHHPDEAFVLAALTGVRSHHWNFGDMPRVQGISQDQVLAIVAFVREQQRAAGIE